MNDLRKRVSLWFSCGWSDWLHDRDAPIWMYKVGYWLIEYPGLRVTCGLFGHEPMADACLRPEHDFCAWCLRATPGRAPRKPSEGVAPGRL